MSVIGQMRGERASGGPRTHVPLQHQEAMVCYSVDVGQVLERRRLLPLRLLQAAVQEVLVVGDRVVAVLVQGAQQLLQAFLDAVLLRTER